MQHGNGWWQASDGNWYPPQASEGWWQASDGNWYPPQASEGWWQASDGNWYPPDRRSATPAPSAARSPAPAAAAAPAERRPARTPEGAAPPADDVAPADSEEGALLVARAGAQERLDQLTAVRAEIDGFERSFGSDPDPRDLDVPSAEPSMALAWALDELRTGDQTLRSLTARRSAAEAALAEAEAADRALRTKAIAAGVAVVLVLVLLVLFVL